jgi:hypothetical protein
MASLRYAGGIQYSCTWSPGLSSVQSPQSHRYHYGLAESHPALLSRGGRCREEILAEQALMLRLQGINLGLWDF